MSYKPKVLLPLDGGTGVANANASTITLGGALTTSGAFASTFTMTNTTNVTFPTSGTLATTSQIPALPVTLANGGTGAAITASNGGIFYSNASTGALLSGTATAGQLLLSGASTTPAWSTSTYPATNAANTLLYASSANVMGALATENNAILATNGSGVPSVTTASGNWQNTSRCCVQAYKSSASTNVTGDGTTYTVIFDTANINVGTPLNTSTGVFTAPVTGSYLVTASITLTNLTAAATRTLNYVVATFANYLLAFDDPGIAGASQTNSLNNGTVIVKMTANDTFTITTRVDNTTKSIGVDGNSDNRTQLSVWFLG